MVELPMVPVMLPYRAYGKKIILVILPRKAILASPMSPLSYWSHTLSPQNLTDRSQIINPNKWLNYLCACYVAILSIWKKIISVILPHKAIVASPMFPLSYWSHTLSPQNLTS